MCIRDSFLSRQKIRQRFSVMKTNTLYSSRLSRELAFYFTFCLEVNKNTRIAENIWLTFWRDKWRSVFDVALVTQPMSQLRLNWSELRSMDYYHQIICRFRKCKRKVPPPSLLSNDFERSWVFSKFLVMIFFFANKIFSAI